MDIIIMSTILILKTWVVITCLTTISLACQERDPLIQSDHEPMWSNYTPHKRSFWESKIKEPQTAQKKPRVDSPSMDFRQSLPSLPLHSILNEAYNRMYEYHVPYGNDYFNPEELTSLTTLEEIDFDNIVWEENVFQETNNDKKSEPTVKLSKSQTNSLASYLLNGTSIRGKTEMLLNSLTEFTFENQLHCSDFSYMGSEGYKNLANRILNSPITKLIFIQNHNRGDILCTPETGMKILRKALPKVAIIYNDTKY